MGKVNCRWFFRRSFTWWQGDGQEAAIYVKRSGEAVMQSVFDSGMWPRALNGRDRGNWGFSWEENSLTGLTVLV